MITFTNAPDVHPPAGHYSHSVEVRGPARLVMLAGQIGMRLDGSVPDDPYEQLDVAFENVARTLRAHGLGLADVVKVTYYHVDRLDRERRLATILAHLGDHKPISTLVYVAGLAAPVYKVEVEVWASQVTG